MARRRQSLEQREERKVWEDRAHALAAGTCLPLCGHAKYVTGPKDLPRWRRFVCAITGQACACTHYSRRARAPVFSPNYEFCPGREREWRPVREAPIMLPKEA